MDAFFIISKKTNEILLQKIYTSSSNPRKIIEKLLINLNSSESERVSHLLKIDDSIVLFLPANSQGKDADEDLVYVIVSSGDDIYIPSYHRILQEINQSLTLAFKATPTTSLIRENIILILLMIDHYLIGGVPMINDEFVLSSLVTPYELTDKISEKVIGIAKTYNSDVLKDYVNNLQVNTKGNVNVFHDETMKYMPKLFFDYVDSVKLSCNKHMNILNNTCFSEIIVNNFIEDNIDLNILVNIPYEVYSFNIDNSISTKKKDILKKKNIDCLSRHGTYTLMSLVPELNNSFILLPFTITAESSFKADKCEITIGLTCKEISNEFYTLDNVKIELSFNTEEKVTNINLASGIGEFEFDDIEGRGYWRIEKVSKGSPCVLKGSVSIKGEKKPTSCACILNMSCAIDKYSVSGGSLVKVNIPEKYQYIDKFYKRKTIINSLDIIF